MSKNLLAEEIRNRLHLLRQGAQSHDKGAIIGFLFSLLPVFPLALVGLLICLFYRQMHKQGKVSDYDDALARKSLLIAIPNTLLSLIILYWAIKHGSSIDWQGRMLDGVEFLRMQINWLFQTFTPKNSMDA